MKSVQCLLLILSVCWLTACYSQSVVIGETRDRIESDSVRVFYYHYPDCDFETVAHIQVYGYFSLASMLKNMRREAAEVGANGLYLLHTQQLGIKEYLGTAKAIHCLSA